ncbi:cobalamin biosynthesis protein [Streptomyces sp. SID9727]|nr:cobalamin biosynthesis protein [Streptomyces sp. SID9727]
MLADGPRSAHLGALVVGVGASRGVSADEVAGLVLEVLREAGLTEIAELVTVTAKAGEPGVLAAAVRLGVPLRAYPADVLARVPVPHPSGAALAALGTPSVAEAAALAEGGQLLVPKRTSRPRDGRPSMATCAVARRPVGNIA